MTRRCEKRTKRARMPHVVSTLVWMRSLRNVAAVGLAVLAIAGGTTLAVAGVGGHARSNSGESQYGVKPGCGHSKAHGSKAKSSRARARVSHTGQRRGCPPRYRR